MNKSMHLKEMISRLTSFVRVLVFVFLIAGNILRRYMFAHLAVSRHGEGSTEVEAAPMQTELSCRCEL